MNSLPYIQPRNEIYLNIGVVLIIINYFFCTVRGKKNLNIERIQLLYFIVNNPLIMNRIIGISGKNQIQLSDSYAYGVNSFSLNVDDLYDKERLKYLIKTISILGYLAVENKDDFVFFLNEKGLSVVSDLNSDYFLDIKRFIESISFLKSKSNSAISNLINESIR